MMGIVVVREASNEWPVLAERCFHALDHDQIKFRDVTASKDEPHNECADKFPPNRYPGMDVSVKGIRFDALQVGVRVLWEIKTHQFDLYNDFIQDREIEKEIEQLDKERRAAAACGYDFVIGVSTQAHKDALLREDRSLNVIVTGCKR
jgi:hypothetical protein